MSPELKKILTDSSLYTLTGVIAALLIAWLLLLAKPGLYSWPHAAAGIVLGALAAVLSLVLIMLWSGSIGAVRPNARFAAAFGSYLMRYAFYALLLFLAVKYWNLPVLSMLLGIMIQKGSLVLYAFLQRKERT
jgi:hypothetical protein